MTTLRGRIAGHGVLLVVLFVGLTGVSWIVANPPGYAPDEPAHYTKAVSVGHRVWVGQPGAYDIGPGFGPEQLKWINQAARVVEIQPNMAPDQLACSIFQPRTSAACLDHGVAPPDVVVPRLTYVGTYEPFLYLPAGLVMNRASNPKTAMLLGRMVTGGIAFTLLALAAVVLWVPGQRGYPLLGLLAAITPMVLFIASGLSPSGPEIGAAICVAAVVLRLGRPEPPGALVWVALAGAGAVLACSRSLGPFYLLADLALLLVQRGPRAAWRTLRGGRRPAAGACAVVLLAVVADVAWGVAVQPHPTVKAADVLSSVGPSILEVPGVLAEDVGSFGWADVVMPRGAYVVWAAVVLALVVVAFAVGRRRERTVLGLVLAGCFTGTVAIAAGVIHQTHFPMYGRYALPLWVILPLTAGETIRAHRGRLSAAVDRRLLPGATIAVAAVHFTGFYTNVRRYAVGDRGPLFFLGRSEWSPPGGTTLWVVLFGLGVLSLLAYAVASAPALPSAASGNGGPTLALEQVQPGRTGLQPRRQGHGADDVVTRQGAAPDDVGAVDRGGEDEHPPR